MKTSKGLLKEKKERTEKDAGSFVRPQLAESLQKPRASAGFFPAKLTAELDPQRSSLITCLSFHSAHAYWTFPGGQALS